MTARHHHYLSQCYLKGFTKGKAKKSKLIVFDFNENMSFETIPRNVGGVRDFNRVDIDGVDQNYIEKELSAFEGKADSALKRLQETKGFSGETKDVILNLIALIAVRSPERREHMRKFEAELADRIMGLSLQSKEGWERQVEQAKNEDPEFTCDVPYEQLKEFFESKEYKVTVTREHQIHMEMVQLDAILPHLFARNWMLVESTESSGPFITSDNPVNLSWVEEDVPEPYKSSPGFGLKGTQVYFPISQDLAVMGEFDREDGVKEATEELVAVCNSTTLHGMYKKIFTPKKGFKFYGIGGKVMLGNHILNEFKA